MMYVLSVGANLILKHFAIKRVNEMIKDDDNKIRSNDVIFNILAFVPIVNIILAGIFGIAIYKAINDKEFDYGFWTIFVISYSYLIWNYIAS